MPIIVAKSKNFRIKENQSRNATLNKSKLNYNHHDVDKMNLKNAFKIYI